MATKNTELVGNQTKQYWINAAKQFIWPIDFTYLQILVPEKDLELANDNLMVSHFRAHGWHVQSSIISEYTNVYKKPDFGTKFPVIDKPGEEPKKQLYNIGDKYRVRSTECELQIYHMEKCKVHLKYLNRNKPNIISSEENLTAVLRREQWEIIW